MTSNVTLSLPPEIIHRAEHFAASTGRSVEDFLAETIELALRPLGQDPEFDMAGWTDEQVLEAADGRMAGEQDRRLSDLLAKQKEAELPPDERAELTALMECYYVGTLRKAQALSEAARRGLRPPPQP